MRRLNFNGHSSNYGNQSGNWRARVAELIAKNCTSKARDPSRPTSNLTQLRANQLIQRMFGWLRQELGFNGLSNPFGMDERHFKALAEHIREKKGKGEIGAAMAASYATNARHVARWIDKVHLVPVFNDALGKDVCKRTLITERDKSWEGSDIDAEQKIVEIMKFKRWVGLVLWAQHELGLRKNEAMMFQPLNDIQAVRIAERSTDGKRRSKKQDLTKTPWEEWPADIYVSITRGTKGKRPRVLEISLDNKDLKRSLYLMTREMLAYGDRDTFAPPFFTLKQNTRVYEHVLVKFGITQKELGVTGHGLRAGFAISMLEGFDITPTVRGGDGQHPDPDKQRQAYKATTEAMGHGRISVIGAYAGCITPEAAARQKKAKERQSLREAAALAPNAADEMSGLVTQWTQQHQPHVTQPTAAASNNHLSY